MPHTTFLAIFCLRSVILNIRLSNFVRFIPTSNPKEDFKLPYLHFIVATLWNGIYLANCSQTSLHCCLSCESFHNISLISTSWFESDLYKNESVEKCSKQRNNSKYVQINTQLAYLIWHMDCENHTCTVGEMILCKCSMYIFGFCRTLKQTRLLSVWSYETFYPVVIVN